MKKITGRAYPLARTEGLIVKEVADEVLVYDCVDDRAHCLNETAALVWQRCDGRTTPRAIAYLLAREKNVQADERIVWLALEQLQDRNLLSRPVVPPPALAGMNRRQMVRALGIAAVVTVPVVTSIVAPTPTQAATCLAAGSACTSSSQCCSGLCNSGTCTNPP